MSTIRIAPTSLAIVRERREVDDAREYALDPAMIIFGLCSRASARTSS